MGAVDDRLRLRQREPAHLHHVHEGRHHNRRPRLRVRCRGPADERLGSLAATDLPAAVASAVYNANNQLTSWAGTALTYDLNGNMTGDGTNTYTWNARDELSAISGGATASFVYDGLGRRRAKTVSGVQTGFVYDGENFVEELEWLWPGRRPGHPAVNRVHRSATEAPAAF